MAFVSPREEARMKRKKKIVSVVIALIMILSVMGFAISYYADDATNTYNGITFITTQNGYLARINGERITFLVHPSSMSFLSRTQESVDLIKNAGALAITYNLSDVGSQSYAQVQFSLEQALSAAKAPAGLPIIRGLINASGYDIPTITCVDATPQQPVLYLTDGNETGMTASNNCIIASIAAPEQSLDIHEIVRFVRYGVIAS